MLATPAYIFCLLPLAFAKMLEKGMLWNVRMSTNTAQYCSAVAHPLASSCCCCKRVASSQMRVSCDSSGSRGVWRVEGNELVQRRVFAIFTSYGVLLFFLIFCHTFKVFWCDFMKPHTTRKDWILYVNGPMGSIATQPKNEIWPILEHMPTSRLKRRTSFL